MLEVMRSLLAVGVLAISAFGLGRPLLRAMRVAQDDLLSECVWSLSLGLTLAGTTFLLLARIGCLYPSVVGAVSLAGSLWAIGEFACIYLGHVGGRLIVVDPASADAVLPAAAPVGTQFAVALAAIVLLASIIAALAPPTSNDALSRSLEIPKNVLRNHSSAAYASERAGSSWDAANTARPNMVHMWYLWALALDGPVAVNLLQAGLGLLVALAVVLLGRPLVGRDGALAAGALVLLCPGVNHQLSVPVEDLALALPAALALGAMAQILVQLESGGWPLAAGVMLGTAIAAQPAGLPLAFAMVAVWAVVSWSRRETRRDLARAGALAALTALLTAGPWLAVAPMEATAVVATALTPAGAVRQSLQSALAHVGPALLIPLAGLVFARRLRGLNLLLAVALFYAALAAVDPRAGRWWSPVVPVASVAAVWAWREMVRLPRFARVTALTAWGLVALAAPVVCCQKALDAMAVASGWQSRDDFLAARVPTYRAAAVVNRIGHGGQRVFCQDSRTFYFSCATTSGDRFRESRALGLASLSEAELLESARAAGCSYLLLAEDVEPASTPSPQAVPTGAKLAAAQCWQSVHGDRPSNPNS